MRVVFALLGLFLLSACSKPVGPARRATLTRTGGTTFELVPSAGQHPYCLAYTVSRGGLTRQLTMSRANQSYECPADAVVGGHAYRVPLNEGPVKVYVLFSSQQLNAATVSQQLLDASNRQAVSVMDMRLPGAAALEALDFVPQEDVPAEEGGLLGADAGAADTFDAGVPADGGPL